MPTSTKSASCSLAPSHKNGPGGAGTPTEALTNRSQPVSKTIARRPFWQIEPCPSWCLGGHEDGDHPDDRIHSSHWVPPVTLSLEAPYVERHDGRVDVEPCEIEVWVSQGVRDRAPQIVMGPQVGKQHKLTADEALELAKRLVDLVSLSESLTPVEMAA